jgi:hypothetical protein
MLVPFVFLVTLCILGSFVFHGLLVLSLACQSCAVHPQFYLMTYISVFANPCTIKYLIYMGLANERSGFPVQPA